jgi:hypothetical protein
MQTLLEAKNTSNDTRRVSFHKAQKQYTSLHERPCPTERKVIGAIAGEHRKVTQFIRSHHNLLQLVTRGPISGIKTDNHNRLKSQTSRLTNADPAVSYYNKLLFLTSIKSKACCVCYQCVDYQHITFTLIILLATLQMY